jgi:hypothetical protein
LDLSLLFYEYHVGVNPDLVKVMILKEALFVVVVDAYEIEVEIDFL